MFKKNTKVTTNAAKAQEFIIKLRIYFVAQYKPGSLLRRQTI